MELVRRYHALLCSAIKGMNYCNTANKGEKDA